MSEHCFRSDNPDHDEAMACLNDMRDIILKTRDHVFGCQYSRLELLLYVGQKEYYYIRRFGQNSDDLFAFATQHMFKWLGCDIFPVTKESYFHLTIKNSLLDLF